MQRDAVLIHLYDMLALEAAKQKLAEFLEKTNKELAYLAIPRSVYKPKTVGVIIYCSAIGLFLSFVVMITLLMFLKDEVISDFALVLLSILPIGTLIGTFFGINSGNKMKRDYRKEMQAEDMRIKQEVIKKANMEQEYKSNVQKMKELNDLIYDSYSINIIPLQFRNFKGVCYLYDFMSTSQENLQSAVMNYNLNRLSEKMDTIISIQADMLLEQYMTNSRLAEIQEQNKSVIQKLSQVEDNTRVASQYSAIAASHAKANTFFAAAKFFENKN